MQTELLSPAGDLEAAYSAFYYGADAIYLGLRRFSARAEAINFSEQDLDEITAFAHAHGKKVYVALNTLLQENELALLNEQLDVCARCKVDALIVQDLGVARVVRKNYPQIALHASTQMAIHNLEGALTLKKMGFERVVLARELSLSEILKIKNESGLEVEVFIHGALCYSYSGLCSFSSLTTGRSANRGKCVYACRSLYKRNGENTHLFSMKDFALEKEVLNLKGLSLKIEGRKKNALYVAALTDYYRRILDTGKIDAHLTDNIKQIFARPWTTLHFKGKNRSVIEPAFVGHRGLKIAQAQGVKDNRLYFTPSKPVERFDGIQIDLEGFEKPFGFSAESLFIGEKSVFKVNAGQKAAVLLPERAPFIPKGAPLYLASSGKVKSAYPYEKPKSGAFKNRRNVSVDVFLDKTGLSAVCEETGVSIEEALVAAKDASLVGASVEKCFAKTQDTAFKVIKTTVHNPHHLFAPMSALNALRRNLFEELAKAQAHTLPSLPALAYQAQARGAPAFIIKTDNPTLLERLNFHDFYEFIIVLSPKTSPKDIAFLPREKVRLSLPSVLRDERIKKVLSAFLNAGFLKYQIGNLGGLSLLPKQADISFDDTISLLNTQSLSQAFELGASRVAFSVEDTKDNIITLLQTAPACEVVIYQDTPLFLSANCVRQNTCDECTHTPQAEEIANGKDKFVLLSKDCLTTVIKKEPFYIGHLIHGLNAPFLRLDFINRPYTQQQVENIIKAIIKGEKLKQGYTGNFSRSFA